MRLIHHVLVEHGIRVAKNERGNRLVLSWLRDHILFLLKRFACRREEHAVKL